MLKHLQKLRSSLSNLYFKTKITFRITRPTEVDTFESRERSGLRVFIMSSYCARQSLYPVETVLNNMRGSALNILTE